MVGTGSRRVYVALLARAVGIEFDSRSMISDKLFCRSCRSARVEPETLCNACTHRHADIATRLLEAACKHFNVPQSEVWFNGGLLPSRVPRLRRRRTAKLVRLRWMWVWLCRQHTMLSWREIGIALDSKKQTVIWMFRAAARLDTLEADSREIARLAGLGDSDGIPDGSVGNDPERVAGAG